MTREELIACCLTYPAAVEDDPFEDNSSAILREGAGCDAHKIENISIITDNWKRRLRSVSADLSRLFSDITS